MASNTQPDEPEIVENHGHMTSCIHKMELNGHFLVNRKQKILVDNSSDPNPIKITIITHTRSIDDRSIIANESFVLGEGEPHRMTETRMTEEEIEQFEKDWEEMWNPHASLHDCSDFRHI